MYDDRWPIRWWRRVKVTWRRKVCPVSGTRTVSLSLTASMTALTSTAPTRTLSCAPRNAWKKPPARNLLISHSSTSLANLRRSAEGLKRSIISYYLFLNFFYCSGSVVKRLGWYTSWNLHESLLAPGSASDQNCPLFQNVSSTAGRVQALKWGVDDVLI